MHSGTGGILRCVGVVHHCGSNAVIGKRGSSGCNEHRRDCRCKHAHCSGRSASRRPGATRTNLADVLHRDEEAQHRVDQISAQLQQLTEQLNKFRPASEQAVGVVQNRVSEQL